MNGKRRLTVGLDTPEPTNPEEDNARFEHKVTFVTKKLERGIVKVGVVVCAYVVLDTARQVIVKGFVPTND